MDWKNIFIECIFGLAFLCLGLFAFWDGARKKRLFPLVAQVGYVVVCVIALLWCIFAVLSAFYKISFYWIVVFVPLVALIITLFVLLIDRLKQRR